MTGDEQDWEPVFRSNYRSELVHHLAWVRKAEALLSIADGLVPQTREYWHVAMKWLKERKEGQTQGPETRLLPDDICGIYLMLAAYGLENLLKAALVAVHRNEIEIEFETTGRLPAQLKTHDLYLLALAAGLKPSKEDEELLRRLGHAAVWYGRYPVPRDHMVYDGEKFSDGQKYNLRLFAENDTDRVQDLVGRTRRDLGI